MKRPSDNTVERVIKQQVAWAGGGKVVFDYTGGKSAWLVHLRGDRPSHGLLIEVSSNNYGGWFIMAGEVDPRTGRMTEEYAGESGSMFGRVDDIHQTISVWLRWHKEGR